MEDTQQATTAETSAQSGGFLGTLGVSGWLFVAQLVNFAIVAVILWRYVFRPLLATMEKRSATIKQGLTDATAAAEAKRLADEESRKIIHEAHAKASALVTEAEKSAEAVRSAAKEKAMKDVEAVVREGQLAIAAERETLVREARKELAGIVVAATEKILKKNIDPGTDAAMIREITL